MRQKPSLSQLSEHLAPQKGAKERVRGVLEARMRSSTVLRDALKVHVPSEGVQSRVWHKVARLITPQEPVTLLGRVREAVSAREGVSLRLWQDIRLRLGSSQKERMSQVVFKWTAAVAMIALLAQVVPASFFASPTTAESSVILLPTQGKTELFYGAASLWEQLESEITLFTPPRIRTLENSRATIVYFDDFVVRLGADSEVVFHTLTDRPEPSIGGPAFTVVRGRVWLQGLIPAHLEGITVATPQGEITVHDASVSISVGQTVQFHAWNGHASVERNSQDFVLISGERIQLWTGNLPLVKKIAASEYQDAWVTSNLEKDAVHRRDIAQLQYERRISQAGILPTSPFYPLKRGVEKLRELTTFDEQSRIEQKLAQADTRLSEAAAQLNGGDADGAKQTLAEYQDTLLALASGTGTDTTMQFLLKQKVAENTASFSALEANDPAYTLRETVLNTTAELPIFIADLDAREVILLDKLRTLNQMEDLAAAVSLFTELNVQFANLQEEDDFSREVRKEARFLFAAFALSLQESDGSFDPVAGDVEESLAVYLPVQTELQVAPLTAGELSLLVEGIVYRVTEVYSLRRSQENQILHELRQLEGHPDEARILYELAQQLEEHPWIRAYVRERIKDSRDARLDGGGLAQ